MSKTAIQFSISMPLVQFNPWKGPLSGATTPGQNGPGSDGNEGVLRIPQSFSITGTSPSDCLVSNPGHSLGKSYTSAEKQSVCSTAPADWVSVYVCVCVWLCVLWGFGIKWPIRVDISYNTTNQSSFFFFFRSGRVCLVSCGGYSIEAARCGCWGGPAFMSRSKHWYTPRVSRGSKPPRKY